MRSAWPSTRKRCGSRPARRWSTWNWFFKNKGRNAPCFCTRNVWRVPQVCPRKRRMSMSEATVARLQEEVIAVLKQRFVDRDEVIDLIALAIVAGEHLFLYGPPGTAKSALIRQFATAVRGQYFEYML